jgi:uncharacterized protein (TIGR04562 family)
MQRFNFDPFVLNSVVGGKSALDMPRLNLKNESQAEEFIRGYGFHVDNPQELERLWYFHRRALVLLEEKLGFLPAEIPEILRDRKKLGDIRQLLLWASSIKPEDKELQRWSCALLRAMHVFVHSENDLFSTFSEEIQKQILTPFQECIFHEGTSGTTYLKRTGSERLGLEHEPVALVGFEVKPFKTSTSTVIKLLAKPSALALNVFDKLGLRFVTHSMFDTFKVVRFLVEENLVSFPHIIPDQSTNSLYPVDIFLKTCEDLSSKIKGITDSQIAGAFEKALREQPDHEGFFKKDNHFSGEDYRFIKFISRRLIQIKTPAGSFSFFYPFEVQIMDKVSHDKILSGPSKHQAYKERQRLAARSRILPETANS